MKKTINNGKSKIRARSSMHNESYRNTLSHVRKHHSKPRNVFSKILHANGMDTFHEYLSFTLVHPKILLSGATTALIGQIISITMSYLLGYSFNYTLFVYYFAVGYIISMIYLTLTFRLKK